MGMKSSIIVNSGWEPPVGDDKKLESAYKWNVAEQEFTQ